MFNLSTSTSSSIAIAISYEPNENETTFIIPVNDDNRDFLIKTYNPMYFRQLGIDDNKVYFVFQDGSNEQIMKGGGTETPNYENITIPYRYFAYIMDTIQIIPIKISSYVSDKIKQQPPIEEPQQPSIEEPIQPPIEEPQQPPIEEPIQPPIEEPQQPPIVEPSTEEQKIFDEEEKIVEYRQPPIEQPSIPPLPIESKSKKTMTSLNPKTLVEIKIILDGKYQEVIRPRRTEIINMRTGNEKIYEETSNPEIRVLFPTSKKIDYTNIQNRVRDLKIREMKILKNIEKYSSST